MGQQIEQDLAARGVAQVIVVLKPGARAPAGAGLAGPSGTISAASAGPTVAALGGCFVQSETSQTNQLLRAAQAGRSTRSSVRQNRARKSEGDLQPPPVARYYANLGVMLGNVDQGGLDQLRKDAGVEAVLGSPPWSLIRPVATSSRRPDDGIAWGIKAMKVPALWKQGLTGSNVVVGHLDTGVDGDHPTLRKAIAAFAEFDDLGKQVPNAKPFDSDIGTDSHPRGHGTHTAATIAGRHLGKNRIGVAPQAQLASAVVIEGGEVVARVLGGMDWSVSQGVRILSMSLGLPGWLEDFIPIMSLLRGRGVLPIFAAGNEGPGTSRSPGNYSDCLSIGAHDRGRTVAAFSSSQRFSRQLDPVVPDLVAPGVDIWSARRGGGYHAMSGTSMATPHVAGLAALLMEAKPDRTIDDIERAILESCDPKGLPAERAGRGAPNAVRALGLL
jgi:subtilisin family serine protease